MTAMGSTRARETVRRLQDAITSGRWPVNSRIPTEADLAAELGVGRSTVREAVRSLAHLGMLEPAPGRGTFVRSLNPVSGVLADFASGHSWEDILAVRKGLEVQAAELAADRRDEAGLERLRAAHEADRAGRDDAERGRTPGQFHAVVVELAGNTLLAELYAALMGALRAGIRSGALRVGQDASARHGDHEALLAAIAAGNPAAAAAVWAAHADHDFRV
jgi:DNA-binding FadR family transcriptional regulator